MKQIDMSEFGPPSRVVKQDGDTVEFWEVPNGYYLRGPAGVFACSGAGLEDEVFGHEELGLLNISKARRAIERERKKKGKGAIKIPIDGTLKRHVALIEVDLGRVLRMTEERRDEPVIFLQSAEGLRLIDGNHRLRRRMMDGFNFVRGFVLYPHTFELMKVQWSKWHNGEWLPYDALNAE